MCSLAQSFIMLRKVELFGQQQWKIKLGNSGIPKNHSFTFQLIDCSRKVDWRGKNGEEWENLFNNQRRSSFKGFCCFFRFWNTFSASLYNNKKWLLRNLLLVGPKRVSGGRELFCELINLLFVIESKLHFSCVCPNTIIYGSQEATVGGGGKSNNF